MGKIRPSYIKRVANELAEKFSNIFTPDFDQNKKLVEKYTNVESKKVRNRIAGYLVSIIKRSQFEYVSPEEEEYPEDYEEYEVSKTEGTEEELIEEEEAEEEPEEEAEEPEEQGEEGPVEK
ncbi:MAG: 30S ribosomal protein S17e [Candidatus Jordarchaeum sp.]|uniref:30S ribosomal protein S17e n=1 Tax=Candidatus Jordarchaeum sp. TaxID=2823881 RepID=UPI004049505E